jgi:hypothetical protein
VSRDVVQGQLCGKVDGRFEISLSEYAKVHNHSARALKGTHLNRRKGMTGALEQNIGAIVVRRFHHQPLQTFTAVYPPSNMRTGAVKKLARSLARYA